ncbi:hypothetical protein ACHAP5_009770 [Fusarium lateritium]
MDSSSPSVSTVKRREMRRRATVANISGSHFDIIHDVATIPDNHKLDGINDGQSVPSTTSSPITTTLLVNPSTSSPFGFDPIAFPTVHSITLYLRTKALRAIVTSFNRTLSYTSDNLAKMTLQHLIFAAEQAPHSPLPPPILEIGPVTVQLKVAISCGCDIPTFHEICSRHCEQTFIIAHGIYSIDNHIHHGAYKEYLHAFAGGEKVPINTLDQLRILRNVRWRSGWHTTLRTLAKAEVERSTREACRVHNLDVATWLGKKIIEDRVIDEVCACRTCHEMLFLVEDAVAEDVSQMLND